MMGMILPTVSTYCGGIMDDPVRDCGIFIGRRTQEKIKRKFSAFRGFEPILVV
jgi:hypothetical protein